MPSPRAAPDKALPAAKAAAAVALLRMRGPVTVALPRAWAAVRGGAADD